MKTEIATREMSSTREGAPGHRYVPLTVLHLLPLGEDLRQEALQQACVRIGNRYEVDTLAADQVRDGLGALLSDYYQASKDLWDKCAQGQEPLGAITIERTLLAERQTDTSEGRVELGYTADLFTDLNGLDGARELLERSPNWASVRKRGKLTRRKLDSTFTTKCPARHYPLELGGVRPRNETARYLTMTTSHAPWRDSRARRLTSVTVTSHEIWPDPTRWEMT